MGCHPGYNSPGPMKLVYIARHAIPAMGVEPGQYVYVVPGAREDEADVIVAIPLPRGRLGHVLGASMDGSLELVATDPPVLGEEPDSVLRRVAFRVSGGPSLSPHQSPPLPWLGE